MYARLLNGRIDQYPLSEEEIRAAMPHVSFARPFMPPAPFVRVWPSEPPELSFGEEAVEASPVLGNGQWRQSWQVRASSPAQQAERLAAMKATKLAALAARRWQAETGGVTVDGERYATDPVAQTKYVGALLAVQSDPAAVLQWKTAGGRFVRLDQAQILGLATAVRQHLQRCFDLEAIRAEQIRAAQDPVSLARIDLESGW